MTQLMVFLTSLHCQRDFSGAEESDLNADLWPRHKRREARGCPKSDDVHLFAGF